jgi:pyruvate,water dikinase
MKTRYTLPLDDKNATLEISGGKGASLAKMAIAGLPVPGGFHITTAAYRLFVVENGLQTIIMEALKSVDDSHPETLESASQVIREKFLEASIPLEIRREIEQAYTSLPGVSPSVAVRSSATAEDLVEASFAGQQETYLNIRGLEDLVAAIRRCWASLWTARAIDYRARHSIPSEGLALSVLVQLLVDADSAGILFTANPVNSRRDQMFLNASWGLGEAVVGGLVTPDSLTLDKSTGAVIERETAEKLVQTVRVESGTQELPVPVHLRRAPVIDDGQAAGLVRLGNEIEALFGIPMDIEWALADGQIAILQARPITALNVPEPPPPAEWKLPKGAYAAMRNNIVELMADPLSPLFKTLGLQAVNSSMDRMLVGFLGDSEVLPSEPIIAVNEYAYYNGSVRFGPMLKIVFCTRSILRRMFTGAVERWTEEGRPKYVQTVEAWKEINWKELPTNDLLVAARELTEAAIDAYGALVSGVIPAAWISEAWFTFTYKFIKHKGDPDAPTFLLGYDSAPIQSEKALYDLAQWSKKYPDLTVYLEDSPAHHILLQIKNDELPPRVNPRHWELWRDRFQAHLDAFGHMIYNLDFGSPVPADDPAPLLETLKMFLANQGANPYERQQAYAERRESAVQSIQARLRGRRLKSFQKNLARAQKYAPLREDGLADVGLSYPLIREMLREVGSRFVNGGLIKDADDIFWLTQTEVQSVADELGHGKNLEDLSEIIPQRQGIWRAARRAEPPMMLPQLKILGVDLMALKSGARKQDGEALKGVAASPGSVTARACVIEGPADFSMMNTGDVLVAPLTTPAWTPLFARAAAVVTDVGGPLSHGSIVAREYGIPAVLGTGAATKRIHSGQIITVDGSQGLVLLSGNDNQ